MIIDASPVSVTLKRASGNGHPDIIQYSVVCFRHYGDYSTLCNHDIYVSRLETLVFLHLWGNLQNKPFKVFADFKHLLFVHHGLIHIYLRLYHSGTTFSQFYWKLIPLTGVGFKTDAIGLRFFVLKWNNISPKLGRSFISNLTPQKFGMNYIGHAHLGLSLKTQTIQAFRFISVSFLSKTDKWTF